MKNFDTFEANLVMSTLSEEDEDNVRENGRTQSQINSQNANIDLDRTVVDGDKNDTGSSTSSSMSLRKRNHADELGHSEPSIGRHSPLEILRKKRRTSAQSIGMPPADVNNSQRTARPSPNVTQLESDELQVVFQDESNDIITRQPSESMTWGESENIPALPNKRDHRPFVREVFKRCFTGNSDPSCNLGEILADCSDEE